MPFWGCFADYNRNGKWWWCTISRDGWTTTTATATSANWNKSTSSANGASIRHHKVIENVEKNLLDKNSMDNKDLKIYLGSSGRHHPLFHRAFWLQWSSRVAATIIHLNDLLLSQRTRNTPSYRYNIFKVSQQEFLSIKYLHFIRSPFHCNNSLRNSSKML